MRGARQGTGMAADLTETELAGQREPPVRIGHHRESGHGATCTRAGLGTQLQTAKDVAERTTTSTTQPP